MLIDRYEWMIGLRYLRAKHSQHFISVITLLSVAGIALGVAALIVVLAVMTGFKEELQRQILGVTSHVVVQAYGGRMADYDAVVEQVRATEGVKAASPYVLGQVMLTANGRAVGVVLRGILPQQDRGVSDLARNLKEGSLDDLAGFGLVVGRNLANSLGVMVGEPVTLMSPVGNVTPAGSMPRMKRFRLVGIFESGMYEYDNTLAYIHLKDAQTLLRMGDRVTGVEVKTDDPEQADQVRQRLHEGFHQAYWVRDWMQMNRNFFRAIQMEKATMFVILFLVVVVAAFNIISSLIMVVMEKGRDIAILKTMGAGSRGVMLIFIINGAVIGLVGTLAGLLLGLSLAFNLEPFLAAIESWFGFKILSGEVYYIDYLPSKVVPADVAWITGVSLLLSGLATLYPAWRAARVDPVEALRYE